MGNCCKKAPTEELKITVDLEEQKAALQSAGDLEVKFGDMIAKDVEMPPDVKVSLCCVTHYS